MLSQTPLHSWHAAHGGRMVDFAGWAMSVQYSSIVAEHQATRRAAGLFDVSHMGRLSFVGERGAALLERIVSRRTSDMRPGQVRYALVTNDAGGIRDDVLVYHLHDANGQSSYRLVVNASNREKIVDWLNAHGDGDAFVDKTLDTAMFAVQGPKAVGIVARHASFDPAGLRYYHAAVGAFDRAPATISRTGYTGEDGCELIVPTGHAVAVWERLAADVAAAGGLPAGLGARDTLRLEAGMPLYGHELTEEINPFQAGLGFAVNLEGRAFPGRDALVAMRGEEGLPRHTGWVLEGKRVPREGYAVLEGDRAVGRVTSGTFSPTLERPIAMGYVLPQLSSPGCRVSIDIRGQRADAVSVELPFYRRPS